MGQRVYEEQIQHRVYQEVQSEFQKGTSTEDIDIKFSLTMMKPLNAKWTIQLYDELTSEKGKKVIHGGWVKSRIFDAFMLGSKNLPILDPFEETEPLYSECTIINVPHSELTSEYENQQQMQDSGESSSEWEISDDDITDRNAFDMFDE